MLQFQSPFVDVGVGDVVALCVFKHQIQISVHLLHALVFIVLHLIAEHKKDSCPDLIPIENLWHCLKKFMLNMTGLVTVRKLLMV